MEIAEHPEYLTEKIREFARIDARAEREAKLLDNKSTINIITTLVTGAAYLIFLYIFYRFFKTYW